MKQMATLLFLLASNVLARQPQWKLQTRDCLPAQNFTAEITYDDCYVDSGSPRTLGGVSVKLSNNSPQACADLCGRFGFQYAGECYCGNEIRNEKAIESSCGTKCPGDGNQICGGTYFVSIWNVENPLEPGEYPIHFPDCNREPLCSNAVCDPSLSPKERATALLSLWTVEEKITNLVEDASGVPRLGIKPYQWWAEGLHGLASRGVTFDSPSSGEWYCATSFPQPILVGAAFDDELVTAMADVIGTETRAYNADGRVGLDLYTPNINSFKDPRWGRGQETPGEDPFHLQSYTRSLLVGLEREVGGYKKVITTCKHYAGNDFESFGSITRHNFDAQISMQDLNEFYLAPFRVCAERNAGAFMCSYNSVNGAPACANSYLMQDILRQHWGWEKEEHYISSDCGAISDIWENHKYSKSAGEAAVTALRAGTDLECEFGNTDLLRDGWSNNLLTEEDMDKALTRMWSALISVGWFDPPEGQELRKLSFKDVNTEQSQKLAYDAAVAGSVLLKNEDHHLPLEKEGKLVLIGPWAAEEIGLDFTWAVGSAINGPDPSFDDAVEMAKTANQILFLGGLDNTIEAESRDRLNITWPEAQLDLIRELSSLGKPISVVQFGGGQLDDSELFENEAIKSVLWCGYPGQSGGKAVIDLIFGLAAPAGRLPVTQYPATYVDAVPPTDMTLRPGQNGTNPGRTHMWYSGEAVVPFGFGLHYTNFKVSFGGDFEWQGEFPAGDISNVGILAESTPWMDLINKPVLKAPISVENTGKRESDYVALVFLRSKAGPEPWPNQTLVGYTRVRSIKAYETKTVEVVLQLERFLHVDEDGNRVLYPGEYELFIDVDERATKIVEWIGEPVVVEKFPHPT
uniref:xylan 1,4-beta-xylosidase n=1 Tax=Bionectria ochroleuca TaxID=29856 RepID=A0A8H7N899_BIOOC